MRAKQIYEFTRNSDPMETMGIGKFAPKEFQTIGEFVDHIIYHILPILYPNKDLQILVPFPTKTNLNYSHWKDLYTYIDNSNYKFKNSSYNGNLSDIQGVDMNNDRWAYWESALMIKLKKLIYKN